MIRMAALASCLENDTLNEQISELILRERTKLLYPNGRSSGVSVIVIALVLAAVLYDKADNAINAGWLAAICLAAMLRMHLVHRFTQRQDFHDDTEWVRRYGLTTALIGLGWAGFVFIGFGLDDWMKTFAVMVVLGLNSLAMPVLVPFPWIM